jgi:hypothetical protein
MVKRKKANPRSRKRKLGDIKRVVITCRLNAPCQVAPPTERVSKRNGDQIEWFGANTGGRIAFLNSQMYPFGWQVRSFSRGVALPSGPVVAGCPEEYFDYAVFCDDCTGRHKFRLAVGRSNPQIKVDP